MKQVQRRESQSYKIMPNYSKNVSNNDKREKKHKHRLKTMKKQGTATERFYLAMKRC